MTSRVLAVCTSLVLAAAAACTSPINPVGAVTVSTAGATVPANGALIANSAQPVTLSVRNAFVSDPSASVRYVFEVSTDSGFAIIVQTKEAAQTPDQTSVKLDTLPAAKDYFWRTRTLGADTLGEYTAPLKFTIGAAVVLQAPQVASPASGSNAAPLRPMLTVTNAARSGPAGSLTYKFELSTTNGFAAIVASGTVAEGNNQTSFQVPVSLGITTTYFWRVQAIDTANSTSSPFANASFTTAFTIDLTKVVYLRGPDISAWKETAFLETVEQDGGGEGPVCMRYADPGWPDVPWPYIVPGEDPDFKVYANQWYFANIGGTWYGGAGEWIYRGAASCKAGQGTTTIGPDAGFGQPFNSWVPKVGELVGYAVSAVARNWPVTRSVDERSNVVVQPWRDTSRGSK